MYIVEFILKKLRKKPKERPQPSFEAEETEQYENCEHVFMPTDSTGEILACTKCGFLIHRKDLEPENPFKG